MVDEFSEWEKKQGFDDLHMTIMNSCMMSTVKMSEMFNIHPIVMYYKTMEQALVMEHKLVKDKLISQEYVDKLTAQLRRKTIKRTIDAERLMKGENPF